MSCFDMVHGDKQATSISFPGTDGLTGPWGLYNRLIAAIPDDVLVRDYALGLHWSYLEAECGAGISHTVSGGGRSSYPGDLRGRPLRDVAQLTKSWCFDEATLGVAALTAWYGQQSLLESMGARFEAPGHGIGKPREAASDPGASGKSIATDQSTDAFAVYRPQMESFGAASATSDEDRQRAKVVVVGHFPHVADIARYASLTVLERNCSSPLDTPDPACEYVIPQADFLFMTGITLTNKTAPRLLALAENATVSLVGPSVVASEVFFDYGVDSIGGRMVIDPEKARFSCVSGERFGDSLQSFIIIR